MLWSIYFIPSTPFIPYTISYILGIVWQVYIPHFTFIIFLIVLFSFIFLSFFIRYYSIKNSLILLFFLLGCLTYQKHLNFYQAACSFLNNSHLNLTLLIIDKDTKKHTFLRYIYTARIQEATAYLNGTRACLNGYIIKLYTYRKLPLEIGKTIHLNNVKLLTKKHRQEENLSSFLKKERIIDLLIHHAISFGVLPPKQYSLECLRNYYRSVYLEQLKSKLKNLSYQLYSLIFLGKKSFSSQHLTTIKNTCKSWGISHHLARSGLHLVICVLVWEKILKYVPIGFFVRQIVILFTLLIYLLLSWQSISFLRSILVVVFYKAAFLTAYQTLSIHLISLISLLVLLHNPFTLLFLDFQLSFGITFLLAWVNHVNTLRKRHPYKNIAN